VNPERAQCSTSGGRLAESGERELQQRLDSTAADLVRVTRERDGARLSSSAAQVRALLAQVLQAKEELQGTNAAAELAAVERDYDVAAARAERDRDMAAARAERDRDAAAARAERDRDVAVARIERVREVAAAQVQRDEAVVAAQAAARAAADASAANKQAAAEIEELKSALVSARKSAAMKGNTNVFARREAGRAAGQPTPVSETSVGEHGAPFARVHGGPPAAQGVHRQDPVGAASAGSRQLPQWSHHKRPADGPAGVTASQHDAQVALYHQVRNALKDAKAHKAEAMDAQRKLLECKSQRVVQVAAAAQKRAARSGAGSQHVAASAGGTLADAQAEVERLEAEVERLKGLRAADQADIAFWKNDALTLQQRIDDHEAAFRAADRLRARAPQLENEAKAGTAALAEAECLIAVREMLTITVRYREFLRAHTHRIPSLHVRNLDRGQDGHHQDGHP